MKKTNALFVAVMLAVGLASLAPDAESQTQGYVGCQCPGKSYTSFQYHPCIDVLAITASIWDGQCATVHCQETPCNYIASLYVAFEEECGGGEASHTDNSSMECGSAKTLSFDLSGTNVATLTFVCEQCPAHAGP